MALICYAITTSRYNRPLIPQNYSRMVAFMPLLRRTVFRSGPVSYDIRSVSKVVSLL